MLIRTIFQKTITFAAICLLIMFNIYTSRQAAIPTSATPNEAKLAVLMYHGFCENKKESTYVLDAKSFEEDIIYLKENGFEFVSTADLINYSEHRAPLPQKCVMITFDDGYLNNYTYAFPIIKKYNVKTVISPIAYWSDFNTENPDPNPSYANMTWEQVKEMSQSGLVEFQNHSYNMHSTDKGRKGSAKASGETSDEYRRIFFNDFMKAHRAIYNATGTHPVAYAYPFGSISDESKTILKCMDYKISFSCNSGFNYLKGKEDELFGLKRFNRTPEAPVSKLLADY
ncbi:MAG: polysaccharide deacetylase family protein [Clostridia bacterium]|nr:polysaccharide deacetylase family protein [Clostridia bacterium]